MARIGTLNTKAMTAPATNGDIRFHTDFAALLACGVSSRIHAKTRHPAARRNSLRSSFLSICIFNTPFLLSIPQKFINVQ